MPYYNVIEWEILQEEKIFNKYLWDFEFPFEMPEIKQILIKRDESYNIIINIEVELNKKLPDEINENIDNIKICSKSSSEIYILKNSHLFENIVSFENFYGSLLKLTTQSILFDSGNNKEITWIKEWYLNGPHNHIIFPRTTKYSKKEIYTKEFDNQVLELQNEKNFEIETNNVSTTSTKSFMFCKLNVDENIIISLVPNKMNPVWSNNISIQYSSKKQISDIKLRGDIENIISFMFGRKLIKIGESYYDGSGNKIKETMLNPSISKELNIKNICEFGDNFPIPLEDYIINSSESIMANIINSFIIKRETLNFSSMFANYWSSTFLPPESKIILLAASLESLKNKWFKSENSKHGTRIIEKSTYDNLIKDIKPQFLEIFKEHKQIIDKFHQLNKLSINKSIERFFDELNIEMGSIEKMAISSRNKPAHGNDIDAKTFEDLIIYSEVYQIIINRVILILLDYSGNYTLKNLIEPIQIKNKLPYSLEELKNNIFKIKTYNIY